MTNTSQHNKYLLEYMGHMFRPVNRSSSGFQQNKSQVMFRYWGPNIFTIVNVYKIWYCTKCETCIFWLKEVKTWVGIWHFGQDLSKFSNTWDMIQPHLRHKLKYDTTWFMTQPEIWYNLHYDTTWNMIQPEIWHSLRYDTTCIMTQPEIWHSLRYDTTCIMTHLRYDKT